MNKCSKCGEKCLSNYCPICGSPTLKMNFENDSYETLKDYQPQRNNSRIVPPTAPPKEKWAAFMLCLFFGWLGAHRFSEGKIRTGILYLLTGGLFGDRKSVV